MRKEVEIQLSNFKSELNKELSRILSYWAAYGPDTENDGFWGKIDNDNNITPDAPKGSVLNARILWTFSAAYNHKPDPLFTALAERAYEYLSDYFIDDEQGGVYWSVDYEGNPLDTKKQVYAIAFTIYALSEFYIASGNEEVKQKAIDLFYLLVSKAYDPIKTGYFEAFTKDWRPIEDLRLSEKDQNEKKTMNTHLHVLEGYTNLYRIWPDESLREHINLLLHNFFDHFINHQTYHLALFFDENWHSKSGLISYGHDIEATWLLLEAAEVIGDGGMVEAIKKISIEIAEATTKGLDADGGLWYEYETANSYLIKEKHWWVQAEAMIGFFNAWQISDNEKYLDLATKNWEFVKAKILNKANGEWYWGVDKDGEIMQGEDKVGLWKCPYHNSRACIEIIKRIEI
ncbi:AGE family epimerase/isomerase [Mucilaginibacter sp. X4EP1]|uniref:AGE family epimerase/isomerase n=1 Tax=Mucilaginibacter sp. X4EP1 TaxID=2723092 RepID=UPI0021688798|nr:AGE family epimerase/isomerase [Mucilaginibacter sp. X4EP1]MCS3816487.1 mannobiose 2-epimerase [Mucilaginibacter sp. X4EP1]